MHGMSMCMGGGWSVWGGGSCIGRGTVRTGRGGCAQGSMCVYGMGGRGGERACTNEGSRPWGSHACPCLQPCPWPGAVSQAVAGAGMGGPRPPLSCRRQPLAPARFLSLARCYFWAAGGEEPNGAAVAGPVAGHSPARARAAPSMRARPRHRATAPPGNVPVPLRSACVAPVRSLSHVAEGDELSVRGQDAAGSGMVPSPPVPGGVGQDLDALPLRAGRHRWPIRPRHPPPGPARRWPWPTAQPGQEPAQFLQRLRLPLQLQQGWSWDPVHPPPDPVHPPPSPRPTPPRYPTLTRCGSSSG